MNTKQGQIIRKRNKYILSNINNNDDIFDIILLFISYDNVIDEKKIYINKFFEIGFTIFPCGLDKTPLYRRWNSLILAESKYMYLDENKIKIKIGLDKKYLNNRPYYNNIALVTGKSSNIFVLDIDKKDYGIIIWNLLLNKYNNGLEIDTLIVNSGGGGRHLYFKLPKSFEYQNSKNRIFIDKKNIKYGIDYRLNSGYIILPPSIHAEGNQYKFANCHTPGDLDRSLIKNIPKWLEDIIKISFKDGIKISFRDDKNIILDNHININNFYNIINQKENPKATELSYLYHKLSKLKPLKYS